MTLAVLPTMGRIVRYVMSDGQLRPAIVVAISKDSSLMGRAADMPVPADDTCDLQVFVTPHDGSHFCVTSKVMCTLWAPAVEYHPDKKIGTWHWPER